MRSNNLWQFRTAKGLTAEKLSALSGVSLNQIADIEMGLKIPADEVRASLLKALGFVEKPEIEYVFPATGYKHYDSIELDKILGIYKGESK